MKRLIRHYLHSHSQLALFLRFATVGIKISLVDAGGVYLLHWVFGLDLYTARILSLGSAILLGYLLNRYFTFGGVQQGCFYRQMAGHFGVHLMGGLVNYGVYSLVVTVGHETVDHKLLYSALPLIGLWLGGFFGMGFNFVFSKKLVYHTETQNANVPL